MFFFYFKFVDVGTKMFYAVLLLCKEKNPCSKEECKVWRGAFEERCLLEYDVMQCSITSVWKEQAVLTPWVGVRGNAANLLFLL
jgi:hypothetical protein